MERAYLKHIRFLAGILLVLGIAMAALCIYVHHFNRQERELLITQTQEQTQLPDTDCTVTIKPRGGSTDQWIKRVYEVDDAGNSRIVQYAGIIYDVMLTNLSATQIRDWRLRIDVDRACFINNAWCGQIEFHQNTAGEEKTQTLDLRKCIEAKTTFLVEASVEGTDIMIPMYAGDYFVYLPSIVDKEDCIEAADVGNDEYPSKRVDFIAYHRTWNEDMTPIEFTTATLTYYLHMSITELPFFYIIVSLFALWCIGVATVATVDVRTARLLEQAKRDEQIIEQSISAFMGFIDAKDPSTNGHSERVAKYARLLAKKLGLSERECKNIYYIGLMHDCGKIGIPDAILNKPDKLTPQEYEIIKTHTTQGGRILQNFTSVEHMREGAMYHHERYDGMGYPEGLKGEEIPLTARILGVADSFDVMNSERCYKNKLTREDILEQMRLNRGTQFDPVIVDKFMELIRDEEIQF